jgi:hypothetical protein
MGGDLLDRPEVRDDRGDAAQVGAPGRSRWWSAWWGQRIKELERENKELRRANEMADLSGRCNVFCELL